MRTDPVLRALFILYCLEAGVLLVVAPWTMVWDRLSFQVPLAELRPFLVAPAVRGGFTGFGLLHLLWGAHDAGQWWQRRRRLRRELAADWRGVDRQPAGDQ